MKEQAILPNFSAFVSASAGTGKTKILIDRLLNLLLHNIKPSKILCLTYTKAASAEVLSRINQKLAEFTTISSEELRAELSKLGFYNISESLEHKARILFFELLDESEPLNIQTIHAFCQQLLLKFPLEAGIDLNFSVLDSNQTNTLITQAKDILINNINNYPKAQKALNFLSWHIKEYSLNELLKEIITNAENLNKFFEIHSNLEQAINSIADVPNEEDIILEFINNIPINNRIINSLYNGKKTDIGKAKKLSNFLNLTQNLQTMLLPEYLSCFLTATDTPIKNIVTKDFYNSHPEESETIIAEQERAFKFNKFLKYTKAINLTKTFITLSYYVLQIYQQLKTQNNCLDYSDLITHTQRLLNNSQHSEWIRYKLDGGIEHILIDEAQDTSSNQWQIINKLCEDFMYSTNKSLFIVGDSKQSIFSFQGAEPALFNQMNVNLPEEVLRVQLNKSFRSGPRILNFIDKIFNQPHIINSVTSIENNIIHNAHKLSNSSIEIWPLIIEPESVEEKPWTLPSDFNHSNFKNANQQLAEKIANMIDNGLQDGSIPNPKDILILTRRRTEFINYLTQELNKLDIPNTGLDRFKLTEHPIILDIISLTNFILCPADDLNLAIILKSPIFNMLEEDLFSLCHNRALTLWEKLKSLEKHQKIVDYLNEVLLLAKQKTPFEFYFHLFEYLGLKNSYAQEANDVLKPFLDLVAKYEATNIPNLQLFLSFLYETNTEVKRDFAYNNQVRIMTVHSAKGLQAHLVVLTDTTSLPFNDDTIIWLNESQLLWPGKEKYYPDIAKEAQNKKIEKEYEEYLRLLYVALTRAEDRLIICGIAKNENISPKSWYSIVKNFDD